ncbi:MAG: sugar ABC transporter substrate-binding protein [Chloroflexi bacterium]|nr:sugar ABC transporter substrate-binding protein [Chloroflexota bacterium]
MRTRLSRRTLLGRAFSVIGAAGATSLLAACQSSAPASKPAETKPAEAKPTQAAAPAAQPAATKPAVEAKPAAEAKPAQQGAPATKKLGGDLRLNVRIGPEEDTLNAVLPKFTEDTGIKVKLESFPTTEYFTKLQTLIAGGTAGDVMWGIYRNTPRFANNKVIMPMDDLIKKDNFDLSQYFPSAIESVKYNGQIYAMPFKLHPGPAALYYNANQVKEAGVTMPDKQPASWDALIEIGKKLTKGSGDRPERYGMSLGLTPNNSTSTLQTLVMYVRSFGGEIYSADGKKSLFQEQPAKDAIKLMHALMFQHKIAVPLQEATQQIEDLMISERISMLQASSSTKSIPTKIGGKFDVKDLLMPAGPTGKLGTQAITDHININAKTQNPEASWELVKLLVGHEVGVRLGGGTGGIASGTCGARIDVFNDPALMANPLHPIFIDLCKSATAPIYPANLREEEVATAVHQTLGPIFLGERQPDDAFFAELNQAVQTVLDRPIA